MSTGAMLSCSGGGRAASTPASWRAPARRASHWRAAARRLAWLPVAAAWLVTASVAPRPLRQWVADICGNSGTPMFASAATPAGAGAGPGANASASARPATKVTVLSCTPLPQLPGKSVTTALVDFPPRAYSPAHRHPGSVTVIVTEGTIRSQLQGEPPIDYVNGQTFFEPPGTLHVFAENPDPLYHAKLIAFFVTDENCGPLTIPEPAGT